MKMLHPVALPAAPAGTVCSGSPKILTVLDSAVPVGKRYKGDSLYAQTAHLALRLTDPLRLRRRRVRGAACARGPRADEELDQLPPTDKPLAAQLRSVA